MKKIHTIPLIDRVSQESGLTRNQVQMWVGQRMNPQSPHHNMAFAYILRGNLNPELLSNAWQKVLNDNDILRFYLGESEGMPDIRHHPENSCTMELVDYSGRENPETDFKKWSKARCGRALPLDGPLVDSVLFKLSEQVFGWYLNQHHIVTDASSTILLFRQVMQTYRNLAQGDAVEEEKLVSYFDGHRSLPQIPREEFERAVEHFQTRQSPGFPRTPFWGKKDASESTESERLEVVLTPEDSKGLIQLTEASPYRSMFTEMSRFAVFSTLTAAWLYLISGQDKVRFDTPVQNRNSPVAKKALGLFIEMFPFAVTIESGETFSSLGEKCMAEVGALMKNARTGTSFNESIKASSAVLNYFPAHFESVEGLQISSEWIHSGHIDNLHGVRFQVHDYDNTGCFRVNLDVNTSVFTAEERERGCMILTAIVKAILQNPEGRIGDLELLTDADEQRILSEYNSTEIDAAQLTVIDRFRRQVEATPDATAIRCKGVSITYSELSQRVASVASRLHDLHLQKDKPVAVFMRRSVDSVAAILGVLESGSSYVPIDPGYPAARIRYILSDSETSLVLTHRGLSSDLEKGAWEVLDVDDIPLGTQHSNLVTPQLSDRAYMIYTSGSTGQPKGVPIQHIGLAEYLDWASRLYVRGETVSFPLFTSLSFDLTVTSLFLPLITGGTLVVYEEADGPLDSGIIDVINDNQVEIVKLTPSHLSLLQQLDLSNSRIRRLILGGEDLKVYLAKAITRQFGKSVEIFNEYGPTEAVVGCMTHVYDEASDTDASVPIGIPADNVQLYVLNECLRPVPPGVPGELCISRNGLAEGYHRQPELTAARFLVNPFNEGHHLYRSGDLVRFNERGLLEYLGRVDRQVKLSGFRIEPGEIEEALVSHPSIESSVVTTYLPNSQKSKEGSISYCAKCGLASNYPKITFDEAGTCSICRSYDKIKEDAQAYFKTMPELEGLFEASRQQATGDYDVLTLLSGGKDSTYVLCRLVDMGLRVYALTLDNGYISDQAKDNIRHVVGELGIKHEFAIAPGMQEIFKDSLIRFSNVCNGCFKVIYTLAYNRAMELGISTIVTGLSRGQFFETRLTESLFKGGRFSPDEIDRMVLEARKVYHRTDDAVNQYLDADNFHDDHIFSDIQVVDFYRYCDVGLSEVYRYLKERANWVRPSDTGRSTNCVVNDVGIYIHNKERGFHNYALPYSWDVRMGHKTREEAIEELQDQLDLTNVRQMLEEIDYDEDRLVRQAGQRRMVAYYVPTVQVDEPALKRYLSERLPHELIPHRLVPIESVPLTANGKVDMDALPTPDTEESGHASDYVAPEGPVQQAIVDIWTEVLGLANIGANHNFFQLGGTSLAAIEVMLSLCNHFDIELPLSSIFHAKTVAGFATLVEEALMSEISGLSDEDAEKLLNQADNS